MENGLLFLGGGVHTDTLTEHFIYTGEAHFDFST